jgi:hypothetical protein
MRICAEVCHNAKQDECHCWCGGKFHGEGGALAREIFLKEFSELPQTEEEMLILTQLPKLSTQK